MTLQFENGMTTSGDNATKILKRMIKDLNEQIDELYAITEPHTKVESELYLKIGEQVSRINKTMFHEWRRRTA